VITFQKTLNIFFQNDHFVAVDKPSLFLSVPSRMGKQDERPVLGLQLQELLQKKVFPIHRLDYGVSGLVLFALSQEAHRVSNYWFQHRQIKKVYHALTHKKSGEDPQMNQKIIWKSHLVRGKKRVYEKPFGQESLTEAQLIQKKDTCYLWELSPLTGRPHQLRYELSKAGFPILGDELYGATTIWPEGIALRAVSLEFLNPDFVAWKLPKKIEAPLIF